MHDYLSRIGRKGGLKSRRCLSPSEARGMVRVREARRAFRKFHGQCFWFLREDMLVTQETIPEIVRGLRQNGGRESYLLAALPPIEVQTVISLIRFTRNPV